MERNPHRHSRFFGTQLAHVISGRPSKFPSLETAANYFLQVKTTFSTGGEEGGRGYAGEVLCVLLSLFPNSTLSLAEMADCNTLAELSESLNSSNV